MATPERLIREPVVAEPAAVGSPPVVQEAREPRAGDELSLRLVLRVDEPCWLEIRADGTVAVEGLMLQGFQKEIRAQEEIRLWLGNAGGVTYWLNDKQGKPLGRVGQVKKDVRVTPDNVGEFVVPGTEMRPQSGSIGRRRPIEANGLSG
jgi:cytoskeleton protein RodZ